MRSELVIDDSYVEEVKNYASEQCQKMHSIIRRYVKAMNDVVTNGIMEGETNASLKEFLSAIELKTGQDCITPGDMASEIERFCKNYISRIDIADKQLY